MSQYETFISFNNEFYYKESNYEVSEQNKLPIVKNIVLVSSLHVILLSTALINNDLKCA